MTETLPPILLVKTLNKMHVACSPLWKPYALRRDTLIVSEHLIVDCILLEIAKYLGKDPSSKAQTLWICNFLARATGAGVRRRMIVVHGRNIDSEGIGQLFPSCPTADPIAAAIGVNSLAPYGAWTASKTRNMRKRMVGAFQVLNRREPVPVIYWETGERKMEIVNGG